MVAGVSAGSLSLLADSIDFAGDAANYGLSLAVLGMSLQARARASLVKAASMAAFGLFILGQAAWRLWQGQPPEPLTMGVVGVLALLTNVAVAVMLYRWRVGDSNMRSVWLCSRNDALGNVAVLGAAAAVAVTGQVWPDVLVAALMATLALTGAWAVALQARGEIAHTKAA
jgi:Co/Zn/Cd efflux system component